jgi:hypothetical protein
VAAVTAWYRELVVTNEVTYLKQRLPAEPRKRRARGVFGLQLLLKNDQLQQEGTAGSEEGKLMSDNATSHNLGKSFDQAADFRVTCSH